MAEPRSGIHDAGEGVADSKDPRSDAAVGAPLCPLDAPFLPQWERNGPPGGQGRGGTGQASPRGACSDHVCP